MNAITANERRELLAEHEQHNPTDGTSHHGYHIGCFCWRTHDACGKRDCECQCFVDTHYCIFCGQRMRCESEQDVDEWNNWPHCQKSRISPFHELRPVDEAEPSQFDEDWSGYNATIAEGLRQR